MVDENTMVIITCTARPITENCEATIAKQDAQIAELTAKLKWYEEQFSLARPHESADRAVSLPANTPRGVPKPAPTSTV